MHRIVLLMAVLTRAIAPHANVTGSPGTEPSNPPSSTVMTPPPTVFRNLRVTSKPRKGMKHGKVDSPMLNYIFDSYATSNKHFHDKYIGVGFQSNRMQLNTRHMETFTWSDCLSEFHNPVTGFRPPSFEGTASEDTIIDADTGSTVIFDCKVTALRDKTVSWIRVSEDENLELLTIDLDTHTTDFRYRVDLAGENWKLALADAKVQDSGVYCCHVSTHPPMLRRYKLTVHPPSIKMSKEAFLETGETLSLKCAILHLHPGDAIPEMHWYRGNSTVSLDEIRGGVLIESDQLTLTSHLQVARLKVEDAGNYTCALVSPVQMKATARVHVLQGSSLAELQSGVKTTTSYLSLLLTSLLVALGTRYEDIR